MKRLISLLGEMIRSWRSTRITTTPRSQDAVLLVKLGQGDYETRIYGESTNAEDQ